MIKVPPPSWSSLSRATVAFVLSAILPGAGSYYLGQLRTAIALLTLEVIGSLLLAGAWRVGLLDGAAAVGLVVAVTLLVHVGGAVVSATEAWRGSTKRPFLVSVGYLLLAAGLLVAMQRLSQGALMASNFAVSTIVMEPTLLHGDRVLVRPLFTDAALRRGELLVLVDPEANESFIRRLVGVPGDQVRIDGSEVTVNGVRLRDGACVAPSPAGCFTERSRDGLRYPVVDRIGEREVELEVSVGDGRLFVLRDRRDAHIPHDPVPREWIRGVVVDVYWSFGHDGVRLDRIGRRVAPE